MDEKILLKTAIIVSIVGLVTLFFVSSRIEIEEKIIENIDATDIDRDIKIKGVVSDVVDREKVLILQVSQPKAITVVVFKDGNISLKEGDIVRITGSVDEYEGKPEIIADEIIRE
jgi:DNA/RNA endonuclease YhcR with UshA esterase domain